ncbi:MAG: phosphoribosylformylglycinamidine cyclo-ligase [Patescibacteria group bacterium]|nr:phosphoribosylformylglycinamidine cyclo-ligase [Patescibacteria group bacterium]MDD5715534.1 phosphoribosylformylglycinamidine cyclo-ligase [Patescibacteria group bacterium]
MTTYQEAGVNISEADRTVRLFTDRVVATYEGVPGASVRKFGQFAALVHLDDMPEQDLGFSMDGIGTKLLIALKLNRFDTVGECLVSHCINDLLTAGVRARVLLDYVATAGLKAEIAAAIVSSIADACKRHHILLVGGELAEMPQVYMAGTYDMVACVQGTVKPDSVIDGSRVVPGDMIYALPSDGLGCNGYSLIRKVFADFNLDDDHPPLGCTFGTEFLKPSKCFADVVFNALAAGCEIHGMANITGGGVPGNLVRVLPPNCRAVLQQAEIEGRVPEIMRMTQQIGDVPWDDMLRTFNMGVGFAVIVPEVSVGTLVEASGYTAFKIGQIDSGDDPRIVFQGTWGSF